MNVSVEQRVGAKDYPLIPWPADDAHKYTRGKLVVVGGSAAYPGAAALAALAAQRMGAGYVEVVCAPESVLSVRSQGLSLVVHAWNTYMQHELQPCKENKPCAYVVGPGFDASGLFESQVLEYVLTHAQAPVLVDGGALGCLSSCVGVMDAMRMRNAAGYTTVLTPHGGEAARLADACGVQAVTKGADTCRLTDFARSLSEAFGAVVVLKGPDTFIAENSRVKRVTEGTAALAKAGTGDVLAGLIGAYLAQGYSAFDAAVSGVMMHAKAGCVAADQLTTISVIPEDVLACIPHAVRFYAGC